MYSWMSADAAALKHCTWSSRDCARDRHVAVRGIVTWLFSRSSRDCAHDRHVTVHIKYKNDNNMKLSSLSYWTLNLHDYTFPVNKDW